MSLKLNSIVPKNCMNEPTEAKYPLLQRWQIMRKQFLEASDWFTADNREKVFNLWYKSMQITQEIMFAQFSTYAGKGYFAADGTL